MIRRRRAARDAIRLSKRAASRGNSRLSAMRGGEGGADAISASCAVVRIKSVLLPAILMEKPFSAAKTAAWTIHSDSNRSRSAFCERSACRFKTRISINEEMTKPLSRAHHQLHCELPYGYIPCECDEKHPGHSKCRGAFRYSADSVFFFGETRKNRSQWGVVVV